MLRVKSGVLNQSEGKQRQEGKDWNRTKRDKREREREAREREREVLFTRTSREGEKKN